MLDTKQNNIPFTPENFEKVKRMIERDNSPKRRNVNTYKERKRTESILRHCRAALFIQSAIYNEYASFASTDARQRLEKHEYWEEAKQYVRAAEDNINRYEKYMRTTQLKDKFPMLIDVTDLAFERTTVERKEVINALSAMLSEYGFRHNITLAYVIFAQVQYDYSIEYIFSYDRKVKSKLGVGVKNMNCRQIILDKAAMSWERIIDLLVKKYNIQVETDAFVKNKRVMDAMETLHAKLGDIGFMNDILREVLDSYGYTLSEDDSEYMRNHNIDSISRLAIGRMMCMTKN